VQGWPVPLLLRRSGTDFLFVGECYMHGIMDGEWLEREGGCHLEAVRIVGGSSAGTLGVKHTNRHIEESNPFSEIRTPIMQMQAAVSVYSCFVSWSILISPSRRQASADD
jgi:hypothetical protein